MTKSRHPKYPKRIRNGCASISENPKMHTCIRISDADSDVRPADVNFGEWRVRVIPWVQYTDHGEGWITANIRKDGDSGRRSFWLAHNGSRFAHSSDLSWLLAYFGAPMDDLARYMRQVWGR